MLSSLHEDRRQMQMTRDMIAKGWCQQHAMLGNRYCLEAALAVAGGGSALGNHVYHSNCSLRIRELVFRELGARGVTMVRKPPSSLLASRIPLTVDRVWMWNDEPGRTKEEVLDVLDAVIRHLDARLAEHEVSAGEYFRRVALSNVRYAPRRPDLTTAMLDWKLELPQSDALDSKSLNVTLVSA